MIKPGIRVSALLAVAAGVAAQEQQVYARVGANSPAVRCFATDRAPSFPEVLHAGDVVRLGETEGDFRRLYLPLGVTGYVHGDYVGDVTDGEVVCNRERVSFRYRPSTNEAPVTVVDHGTRFRLLAREGHWLRVRCESVPAWIAVADVTTGDEAGAEGWQALESRQREDWQAALAAIAEAEAEAEAKAARESALAVFAERLAAERAKPEADRAYEPLREEVAGFVAALDEAALPDDAPERTAAGALLRAIHRDVTIREANALIAEDVRPAEVPAPPPVTPVGPLDEYDAKGWLRLRAGRAILEKGGQPLFELGCVSGKFDLSLFDGLEVGVRGPRARREGAPVRNLDVEGLVVLSTGMRQ